MRLDGFGILVDDMAKMIRFYRDVLGFEIREREDANNVYLVKDGTLFLLYGRGDFEQMTGRRYEYVDILKSRFTLTHSMRLTRNSGKLWKKERFRCLSLKPSRGDREPATSPTRKETLSKSARSTDLSDSRKNKNNGAKK